MTSAVDGGRRFAVLRGADGYAREALLKRLDYVKKFLEGTQFSFKQVGNVVETTCPWGNRIRMHGPEPEKFGPLQLGMPYVELEEDMVIEEPHEDKE